MFSHKVTIKPTVNGHTAEMKLKVKQCSKVYDDVIAD